MKRNIPYEAWNIQCARLLNYKSLKQHVIPIASIDASIHYTELKNGGVEK